MRSKSMIRNTLIGLLRGLAVVPIAATLLAALGRLHWLLDIFTSFHLQYALALGLIGLLALLLRRFMMTAVVGLTLLWNITLISLHHQPQPAPQLLQTEAFQVLSFNIHTANPDHAGTLKYLQQQDADVVLLLEVNGAWVQDLTALEGSHPYHLTAPREDNFGIALYSRIPMTAEIAMFDQTLPSISATLNLTSAPIHFIGTHPLPPTGPNYARLRNRQLTAIADAISNMSAPKMHIVAGDFNASPWSVAMQPLFHDAGLLDAAAGFTLMPTWFAIDPVLGAPIDHVLVSRSITVRAFEIGPALGSDHRPLLTLLNIA